MLKIIGSGIIFLASAGLGYSFGLDVKKRIYELKYIKRLMLMLRGEIKYAKTPLAEAFQNIGSRSKGPFQKLLENVARELDQLTGRTFQEIWREQIEKDLKASKLLREDMEQLVRVGENIGYLDGEMQIGNIDLYLEQLELEIGQAERTAATKTRVYNCLGIMGGLFIVVIMI